MQVSYTKNYFKIYATQLSAVAINVLSLVIVIPYLSGNASVYGIYSLCISFTIFFSYADIGFLNAGYKYASEYYAQGNREKETQITGFITFILATFVLIFSVVLILFALNPQWLIKNISGTGDTHIAKSLLLTLALFSPNMVLQRMLQIIYGIRVQEYILQTILIVVNVVKIALVYFFIGRDTYNIQGYFLSCQAISTAGLLFGLLYARSKYNISLKALTANIRFSKEVFQHIKSLAFNSLYITIAWILFYEFDPYVIAKLSGAEAVAFYSIGLTCLAFFRSIFGSLFGPFNARFNHFIAFNDLDGLITFSKTVMCILLPAVVFPTLSLALLSKPFVFAWVGSQFHESVGIVTFLSLCNILGFVTYPAGILSMATKKTKLLYIISSLQVIIYWSGIAVTFPKNGYIVFAWFELVCFSLTSILYIGFICSFLQLNFFRFIKEIILPAIIPVILLLLALLFSRGFLPLIKGKLYLFEVILTGASASLIATLVYYFTSEIFRKYINRVFVKFHRTYSKLTLKNIFL